MPGQVAERIAPWRNRVAATTSGTPCNQAISNIGPHSPDDQDTIIPGPRFKRGTIKLGATWHP